MIVLSAGLAAVAAVARVSSKWAIIDLVLLPFRIHVEVLASENAENGSREQCALGKGTSVVKPQYQAPHPKTMENRSPMVVKGHGIGGKVIPAKMARLAESQLLE